MIVLDTNVLSELLRRQPSTAVLNWLDGLPETDVATTAVTAAELLYGVERLPDGHRKAALTLAIRQILDEDFVDRVESFDNAAAGHYATIVTGRATIGRPINTADAQIAAICRRLGATIATRNVKDFEDCGITVLNPWDDV